MADLPRLERAQRRIPQGGELDAIGATGRAFRPGSVLRPNGLVAAAPQADARGFIDESRGLAMAGQGVAQVGDKVQELAWEKAQAIAERQANDFEGTLAGVETETAVRLTQEQDETKWGGILTEQVEKARAALTEANMMPAAKDAAEGYLSKWQRRQEYQVGTMQAKQAVSNAARSISEKAQRLENAGDFAGAAAVWQSPAAEKYHGGLVVAQQVGRLEEQARREAVVSEAAATPGLWLDRNPEPGDMNYDDWQAGQRTARGILSTRVNDAASEIGDLLASGDIKGESDIERVAAGRLSPAALADAKADLRKMQSEAWRAENLSEKGVTKNFGLLLGEVEKYDKAADPDGTKYAGLVWKIKSLMPEELRGEITQPLARKWNPGTGPDAPEPLRGFVRDTLSNWYKDGKFGATKKKVPLTPEDPGWMVGTKEQKWEDDPPARDAAAARRGEAEMEMQKWLKANPGASIKEAKDQLLRSTSAALLPGDVNSLLRRPAPPPATLDIPARLKEMGLRFGGVSIPATGDLGAARTTVFGGPNDPADNGQSAFGGATGSGGREGVAVPEKILRHFYGDNRDDWERVQVEATLPDGSKKVLPIADLGTAEWVWKRDGKPVVDLTPGAVEQLGGDVIYGKRGTLKGAKGLAGVSFRLLPLDTQKPPFDS